MSRRGSALALAALGFALSALLEYVHVTAYGAPGATSFCGAGPKLDCTSVALSRYSVALGLPLPIWGLLGFLALGLAAWLRSAWLVPLAFAAALGSLALIGVELARLGTLCLLCEGVHAVCLALAFVAWRSRHTLVPLRDTEAAALVLLPSLGAMVALVVFLPPYWRVVGFRGALPFAEGVTPDGAHWIGAANPKLTVEEYTDYLCPHCRVASAWTLHRLAARPDDVRLVRRQQPAVRCSTLPGSCDRLRFAYCGEEQGHFWQTDRWLFAHGEDRHVDPGAAANELGLDVPRFESCVERPDTYARAEREAAAAVTRRFLGTPTYVVNGRRIPPATIDRLLAQGRPD